MHPTLRYQTAMTVPSDGETWYESPIDLSIKNNAHTLAYELIRDRFTGRRLRILDVGCASGPFGAALRQAGHEVWGIEKSSQAAVARDHLDHLFLGTVEEFLRSGEATPESFDVISFIDVLEHLVGPSSVLRDCAGLLRRDGAIVASLPNVAHMAVRVMLLEGRWEYADLGILDRTHLRFFTRRSILDMMADAGLTVHEVKTVVLPVELAGITVDPALLRKAARLVRDEDALVFQYVLLAGPAARTTPAVSAAPAAISLRNGNRPPRVVLVEPLADWSVGEIRFRSPLAEWRRVHGGEFHVVTLDALHHDQMKWADVIVFQREAPVPLIELAADLRRLGKRVIFEIDDLLTQVPPFLASYAHSQMTRGSLEQMIRTADAVTVTTPRLRDKLLRLNPRIFVVPNCSYPTAVMVTHDDASRRPVTLLVASSDTVRVEFIVRPLGRLCADPRLDLRIVAVGPPGDHLARAGLSVECRELMGHEQFKVFIGSLENPIGLIPLDPSEFSSCKSAIKFVDYSLAGIPSVCSAVPPYVDVVRDGVTGLLVPNRDDEWEAAVRHLVGSADSRRRLAAAARAECLERFSLRVAADAWASVFSEVLSQSPPAGLGRLQPALRRLARPSSYANGLRIMRREGVQGIASRLRFYLGSRH
jgi:2-polyprenyl-3-methyl-5-hydroxy-6-metoxy-1,4-benzoquinol methylase